MLSYVPDDNNGGLVSIEFLRFNTCNNEAIWAGAIRASLLANGVVAMDVARKVTLPEARAQPYSS